MTISYNWLSEYLPEKIEPQKLSKILTSIGLEVESLDQYESIKGGLKDLVIGQVIECEQHKNADKLKVTKVSTGNEKLLQIVCGAPNVATGEKVVVAPVGATIYPVKEEPVTMKVVKIRGVESYGMICAEDEIGIGENHSGIIILPNDAKVGMQASEYFKPYTDWIFEIGLTPNRMDAMSHLGVAKDLCAYLSHHNRKSYKPKIPFPNTFKADNKELTIEVIIENADACQRYSGISIKGVTVSESPEWLQNRLKAIGQRPINNIVDITNYILHETGQPLHVFDNDEIKGNKIIVKNLPEGTKFKTLDGNERKLSRKDLMICNIEEGMCIAGVYGGIKSGVKETTKNIFIESAWFNPLDIRKTSFYHNLRTDAANRFEKGVDISNTVNVLKRAALLIKEIAGGKIAGEIVDAYPEQKEKKQIALKYHYLKKLSGKNYHHDTIIKILESLGFELIRENIDELWVAAPYDKHDILLPADLVEEIIRIDGLDNIEIPATISITPATEGPGLNSITNSLHYSEQDMVTSVKMINNLSADLDVLRPSMLETALESIAYNIKRKNNNLRFFEFGKTYSFETTGIYKEEEHFALYITGNNHYDTWREKAKSSDFFMTKGIAASLLNICGLNNVQYNEPTIDQNGLRFTSIAFGNIENAIKKINLSKLQEMRLFDVFESDKLGEKKKSLAISFTFVDEDKTLTDKEIDDMMENIMKALEKELKAEIRK